MSLRGTAKWVGLALVGLAIAVGVAVAAANLASQQIGISSESVTAGDRLAPSFDSHHKGKGGGGDGGPQRGGGEEGEPTEGTETTAPVEETTPAEPPVEETTEEGHGSDDRGGGSGSGSGDSDD